MEIQTVAHRRERGDVLAMMLKLASGPEGLTNAALAEKLDTAQSNIAPRINGACARGHLHRSQRQGFKIHWFDTAERAQAWAGMPPPHKPRTLVAAVQKPMPDLRFGKKPEPYVEKHTAGASKLKAIKADKPVDASGAKFTLCPSGHDTRYTANPAYTEPLFSSLGVGRYLQEVAA